MTTRRKFRSLLIAAALSGVFFWEASAGASEFVAAVDSAADCVALAPSPASDAFANTNNGQSSSSATATAGPGFATLQVSGSSEGTSTNFAASAVTCYAAQSIIDDLVISGPVGTVAVQLEANLNGTFSHSGPTLSSVTSVLFARIRVGTVNQTTGTIQWVSEDQVPTQSFSTPLDSPYSEQLVTPVVDVPTNVPIAIELFIDGRTTTSDTLNNLMPQIVNASVNFSDGLRLPTGSPALILPSGFRADSVDGQIVDSHFVGPANPVPSVTASGLVSLTLCITVLGTARARRAAFFEDGCDQ